MWELQWEKVLHGLALMYNMAEGEYKGGYEGLSITCKFKKAMGGPAPTPPALALPLPWSPAPPQKRPDDPCHWPWALL